MVSGAVESCWKLEQRHLTGRCPLVTVVETIRSRDDLTN